MDIGLVVLVSLGGFIVWVFWCVFCFVLGVLFGFVYYSTFEEKGNNLPNEQVYYSCEECQNPDLNSLIAPLPPQPFSFP